MQTLLSDRSLDSLSQIYPVTSRAMFGGLGLYHGAALFGLLFHGILYFRVDDRNRQDYIQAGSQPFIHFRGDRPVQMSYYRLPDAILSDPQQLKIWIDKAIEAAYRARSGYR